MVRTDEVAYTLHVLRRADTADQREDISQGTALFTGNVRDMEQWLKDLDMEIACQSDLRTALVRRIAEMKQGQA